MTDIITQIAEARGNRKALLALASSETCDAVAYAKGVTPIYAATFVAQRLFDATEVTIKSKGQPGTKLLRKRYDLTDANQAYRALEQWGIRNRSNAVWKAIEGDADRYYEIAIASHGWITRHCTSELSITRHK